MFDCQTIGTCSLCGGPVQVPTVWMGVVPPVPTCGSCGATKGHGPVIDMVPAQRQQRLTQDTATYITWVGNK